MSYLHREIGPDDYGDAQAVVPGTLAQALDELELFVDGLLERGLVSPELKGLEIMHQVCPKRPRERKELRLRHLVHEQGKGQGPEDGDQAEGNPEYREDLWPEAHRLPFLSETVDELAGDRIACLVEE